MKKYKDYMDHIRASDTLHQRLVGLEASGKRPIPWKRYGAMAAALALVVGLGTWWMSQDEVYYPLLGDYDPAAPEIADEPVPDIALVEPGDMTEPGEKTLGGYDVTYGSGPNAMAAHYVLPYIEYSDVGSSSYTADWDIPSGATRQQLTEDEIVRLMGGEDAVNVHLDWGEYLLTGWAAWYEDGSFWGAYINGQKIPADLPPYASYPCPDDRFEFAVTAGQLPPTCIAYPESVTQEIRGLTVTADKTDIGVGSVRRVSFMKGDYGYHFEVSSTNEDRVERTEVLASRLLRQIADQGINLSLLGGTNDDSFRGDNWCGDPAGGDGADAAMCSGYPVPDPGDGVTPDMSAPPKLNVVCGDDSLTGGSGNYEWTVDLGNGLTSGTNACGLHPLDYRDAPSLNTAEGRAKLSFAGSPDRVRVVCWPDSEWGNTAAASQECSVARSSLTLDYEIALNQGGWIYEVSAEWDGHGTASYVFYITKN